MKLEDLPKFKIVDKPGVYFFQSGKKIFYIGKATSLKSRVKSYFAKDLIATRGPLIVDMVFKASSLKWEATDSVLEALILEAALIKKHQPYYNTKEKDDKSWNYVGITKESVPKVLIIRGKEINFDSLSTKNYKLSTIYGPFTSGPQLREALKIIRRIFPFIDKSSAPKDPAQNDGRKRPVSYGAGNYEFYRQLGLAPEMGDGKALLQYRKNIKHLKLFFEGKKKKVVRSLEKEMTALAKQKRFEEAARVRNQLFALKHINDVALIKTEENYTGILQNSGIERKSFRIEAYDIAHLSGKNMVGVMVALVDGVPEKASYRKFIIRTQEGSPARPAGAGGNDTGALEEVLSRRFRHTEWGMPDLVVVDGGRAQISVAERVLKRYQFSIPIVSVLKDERHKPKMVLGDKTLSQKNEKAIILANAEAHRFAITFHKLKRKKNFLP